MLIVKILLAITVIVTAVFAVVRNLSKDENRYQDEREDLEKILKLRPFVYGGIGVITLVIALITGIYFTDEQDIGFTTMFGKNTMIDGPGMHFKVPFISEKHVYDATTKGMAIGYDEENNESEEADSLMITSDINFVNIDFYIEYRISDPIQYCYETNNPELLLKDIAMSAIRNTVGQYDVDSVMTTGKPEIESKVFDDIVAGLEDHSTGLTISNVTIQDSEPPTTEVATAFKDVENAKQNAETVVNKAHEYENTKIPAAEAEAEKIKQAANAAKTERVNQAKEEVAEFEALFTEYQKNPDTVKQRLYYEALEEILPNMEIIIGEDSKIVYIKGSDTALGESAAATSESEEKTETETKSEAKK